MFKAKQRLTSLIVACVLMVASLFTAIATLVMPQTTAVAEGTEIVFDLGANGTATHSDGSSKTTYTETADGYTLSITNGSQFYTGARDAKGNSCFKLGSSKNVGSFKFTVPADVTSVIISVAGYKTNTAKISVNSGTTQTISTLSDNAAYTDITVDTSSTKTVSFTTVSGGYRAMVNTITFVISAAEGACEHVNQTTTTVDATCTENGSITVTCDDCGETISTETIDALGHNYVDGFCSVCDAEEPNLTEATITFDDAAKRITSTTTQQVWQENGITVTYNKGDYTNDLAEYANPIRLYKGTSITIDAPGAITKLVFNAKGYTSPLSNSIDNATVDGDLVTVTIDSATSTSFTIKSFTAQTRIYSIIVTYNTPDEPVCLHENKTTTTVDKTCTTDGSITTTCVDCGEELGTEVIPAAHTPFETITNPATCTEDGSKDITCSVCSEFIETVEIPATGHNIVDGKCSVCGEAQAASATITFDSTVKRTEFSTTKQVWVENGITVTNNKASSTTNVANYSDPVRFYKNSQIVITYSDMAITKIVFYCNKAEHATNLKNSINSADTVEAQGLVVTVTLGEATNEYTLTLGGAVWLDSIVVDTTVPTPDAHIDYATITIGADLKVNYYVSMPAEYENATMSFTVNGADGFNYVTEGTKVGEYYVFTVKVGPHQMAENISATLYFGETVLAAMENYSIKTYAQNKLNDPASSDALKQLLTDLLVYGDAAYNYVNETTGTPVTDGVENLGTASSATPDATENKFELSTNAEAGSYPVYFKSVTVWFGDTNKIRATITRTDDADASLITVKINGVDAVITGNYIYTDDILATGFADIYTFELSYNGVVMQTLTYSVNTYACKKGDALALALYRYGLSAKAYIG